MKKKIVLLPLLFSLIAVAPIVNNIVFAENDYDPEKLADDDLAKVSVGEGNDVILPTDDKWTNMTIAAKPLAISEEYVENWSTPTDQIRLRPYHVKNGPDEEFGAEFSIENDDNGKAVHILTDGSIGGAFDYVKFAGMRYTENALYHVDITYTTVTPNRGFKVGFEHNYFLDLSGSRKGEVKTASGEFSATSDVGYNNNLFNSLIVMVAGGETSAEIVINEIKIKRLFDKPTFSYIDISGSTSVGSYLNLDYGLVLSSGINEKHVDIKWFLTSSTACLDKYVLDEFSNEKTLKIPSYANGKYIGVILQPFSDAEGISGIGDTRMILKGCVGESSGFSTYRFAKSGDTLVDNFDDILSEYHVGFEENAGVVSYISDENAISGKSLFINNKTNETMGGYFTNIKFKGGESYSVSFKIKFLEKPQGLFFQFRAIDSLGYSGDVKSQLGILSMEENETYKIIIPPLKLANVSDYRCQIFSTTSCSFVIDDLQIKLVQTSDEIEHLKELNSQMIEDFDTKNILSKIDTFEWEGISIGDGFDGNGFVFKSRDQISATCYFYDFIGKLGAGYTYTVEFDYQLITPNFPQEMYFGVRNMSGNQDNVLISFAGKDINTTYHWSHTFVMPDKDDMYFQLFNMAGDSSIVIFDNLTIKCISVA